MNLDLLGHVLVTFANGAWGALGALANPLTLAGIAGACGLGWLALCEIEELDRQGAKPEVGRH
jgi:hypothetical protein